MSQTGLETTLWAALAGEMRGEARFDAGARLARVEPGCLSVFKDEMTKLLPDNAFAAKLSKQAVSLGEVLQARGWKPSQISGKAFLHGHCHQNALGNTGADLAPLQAAGIETSAPETLIVADGFSCRGQIEGLAGRGTLHLADVLARTLA